jgi:ABC-type multidrug transport system fused ATPase/permease subunit
MASPPASSDAGANLVARPRSALDILGRVAPYLLRHRTVAAANFACAALALGFSLAFPQIIQHIIDDVIAPARADLLLPAVLVLAAAFLLRAVFTALRIVANNVFEQNVILDMRRDLYARLQLLPVGFFDRSAAGDLMTRLNDDVVAVERIVIDGSEQGAIALLSVAAVFAILCAKNGELALLALIPLPLLAAAIASYSIMSVQQFRALRGARSNCSIASRTKTRALPSAPVRCAGGRSPCSRPGRPIRRASPSSGRWGRCWWCGAAAPWRWRDR